MLILALDTTSRTGSLALLRGTEVLYEMTGDPALTHAQRLPRDFSRVCAGAGVPLQDVELLAVAAGPGSFTGLRVGIAAMQGLAFAHQRKVVPVPTLEAIAATVTTERARVAAWMDGQRNEVFAALFQAGGTGDSPGATPLLHPTVGLPEDVLAAWLQETDLRGVEFQGDGAVRYASRIEAVLGTYVTIATTVPPLAAAIGLIAARAPERAVAPHAIVPIYIRRPDAELARERRPRTA